MPRFNGNLMWRRGSPSYWSDSSVLYKEAEIKNASLRAGGHSRPLPHPLPSNFSPFWFCSTWRQKSKSPHRIFRLLTRPPATQAMLTELYMLLIECLRTIDNIVVLDHSREAWLLVLVNFNLGNWEVNFNTQHFGVGLNPSSQVTEIATES